VPDSKRRPLPCHNNALCCENHREIDELAQNDGEGNDRSRGPWPPGKTAFTINARHMDFLKPGVHDLPGCCDASAAPWVMTSCDLAP
jgi:hypothetical protein